MPEPYTIHRRKIDFLTELIRGSLGQRIKLKDSRLHILVIEEVSQLFYTRSKQYNTIKITQEKLKTISMKKYSLFSVEH